MTDHLTEVLLSEEDFFELTELFERFDLNGDGYISHDEFHAMGDDLANDFTKEEIDYLTRLADDEPNSPCNFDGKLNLFSLLGFKLIFFKNFRIR